MIRGFSPGHENYFCSTSIKLVCLPIPMFVVNSIFKQLQIKYKFIKVTEKCRRNEIEEKESESGLNN